MLICLFCGSLEAVGCFTMKLNISFPATGCHKLTKVDGECKLHTFYEKHVTQKLLLTLWVKNWKGYVVQISGGNDKVSPWSRLAWPMAVFSCCWVRGIPIKSQRGLEKVQIFGVVLWISLFSILNLVIVKEGEKDILDLTDTAVPHHLGSKRSSRICKLVNLKKMRFANVL